MTRELAAGLQGDDLWWRISVASIDRDGAFSAFPRLERRLTVIAGAGVALTIDGHEHLVRCGDSIEFSGNAVVRCALPGGPVEALNVMTRRGMPGPVETRVRLEPGSTTIVLAPDLAVLLAGSAHVTAADQPNPQRLEHLDALVPTLGRDRHVAGAGQLLVLRLPSMQAGGGRRHEDRAG